MAAGRFSAQTRRSKPIRTGATTSCFTSTSTVIQAEVSGPAIRLVGQERWPSCLSRPRAGKVLRRGPENGVGAAFITSAVGKKQRWKDLTYQRRPTTDG